MTERPARKRRAVIDANVLISTLLNSDPARSAAAAVVMAADAGAFSAVVPAEAIDEAVRVAASKPWLVARISPDAVQRLLPILGRVAEVAPPLFGPIPEVSRDPGDDYLVAQAVRAGTECLVTRDKDLLDLEEVAGVRIVDPVAFLALLRATRERSDTVSPVARAAMPPHSPRPHPAEKRDRKPFQSPRL